MATSESKPLRVLLLVATLPTLLYAAPAPAPAAGHAAHAHKASWGYTRGEDGPSQWSLLDRENWGICTTSHKQSPLNIIDHAHTCQGNCDYSGTKEWTGDPINVKKRGFLRLSLNALRPITGAALEHNGHTLIVSVPKNHDRMFTTFEGRQYDLLQYHFHRSSEHTVNSYQFPLEMHMVHRRHDGDKNDLLVVSILFEVGNKANLFLNALGFTESGLPRMAGETKALARSVNPLGAIDEKSIYNDAATQAMRDSMVLSLRLSLRSRSLSPAMISAFRRLKDAWDAYSATDQATSSSLRSIYAANNPFPDRKQDMLRAPPSHTEAYHNAHADVQPMSRQMLVKDEFSDVFFVDVRGNLIYSVHKENDFATNFQSATTPPYGGTGLGEAYRAAMASPDQVHETSWEPYAAGEGGMASFLATGMRDESGALLGAFCVRLPEEARAQEAAVGSGGGAAPPAGGGHRRLLSGAPPPAAAAGDVDAPSGDAISRTPSDLACGLRLNHMRIDAGCHNSAVGIALGGHRRRAGGEGGAISICPTCASTIVEATSAYKYWTYSGSLTTPPCSEGVRWVVLQSIAFAASNQIATFPFRDNFRPPMPIFSRDIFDGSAEAWEWGYEPFNGPRTWAANGFSYCNAARQSPINIETSETQTYKHFDYIPQYEPQYNLYIVNTGRSIEVQLRLTKSHISLETGVQASFELQTYFLTKIQFHKNSEHTIDGVRSEMEAQFHHRQEGDAHTAPHMVVSVMYRLGACDLQLEQLNWNNLPQTQDTIGMHVPDVFLVEDLMPMNRRYWTYDGTLTSPPCTPGVTWVILQEARTICTEQLARFPLSNSRDVQPMDDRFVQVGSFRASDAISSQFWHWDYYHQFRPSTWGRYYRSCTGSTQSPINIIPNEVTDNGNTPDKRRLVLHWHSMCGVRTRNTGHTIVVDMPAGTTEFEEVNWRVLYFHFHAPSEHQIDGHISPLEMQIVHSDTHLQGRNLVISILFYEGSDNQFLDGLEWASLPQPPHSKADEETHEISKPVDLMQMINNKNNGLEYYQYMGSLTQPPCESGVQWVVMTHSDHLSAAQLLSFYNVLHYANFRTPQPLGSRTVQHNSKPHEVSEKDLWGYDKNNGPDTWGAAGFPHCLERQQSPIDLETKTAERHRNYALDWSEWRESTGSGRLQVLNDHNRLMEVKGFGKHSNRLIFEGQYFFLKKILFHKSAETRIDGQRFDFEAHLIHENEVGMHLYLVVLFKLGASNKALAKLMWDELPGLIIPDLGRQLTKSMQVNTAFSPMEIIETVSKEGQNPSGPTYYHYDGSMSTPPCDEGVTWVVLEQLSTISMAQLAQFPFSGTIRPVAEMNGRHLHYLSAINVPALLHASRGRLTSGKLTDSAGVAGNEVVAPASASAPHRRRVTPLAGSAQTPAKVGDFEWGYGVSNGPLKWARHHPACIGVRQSPITIDECHLERRTKNKMRPRWKFTPNLSIKNDGHSLVVEDILNSYTEFEGQAYVVTHFQFHSGSEHLLHAEQYPLELQVVHVLAGRPALIVSVVFEVGAPNADLTSLHFGDLKNIPKRPGQQASIDYPFNPVHFLPYNKNYYTYEGSLTAPPCAEGIKWVVMQSTMTASSEQIASFPFHGNFRNAQRMMGRPVYFMSEKDLYLYKTAVGSSHILHMSWTLLLGTVTTLLTLAH